MHYYITYLAILCCLATPLACRANEAAENTPTSTPGVLINEIYPNPATGSKEWVELYNPGPESVNLEGWRLCDNRATNCTIAQLHETIGAGEWLLVTLSSSVLNNTGDSVLLYDTNESLADQADYTGVQIPKKSEALARLVDGTDTDLPTNWSITLDPTPGTANNIVLPSAEPTTDMTMYSPPLMPAAPEPKLAIVATTPKPAPPPPPILLVWKTKTPMLARLNEEAFLSVADTADKRGGVLFFSWNISGKHYEGDQITHRFTTSGLHTVLINATSTSGTTGTYHLSIPVVEPTTTPIITTEVYPDDEGSMEFIELYNTGTTTVDIGGWKIMTESGDHFIFPPKTIFTPYGYRVFYKPATGLELTNNGTTLYLLNSSTTLANSITYSKLDDSKSYQLAETGWQWLLPTPSTPPLPIPEAVLGEKISTTLKQVPTSVYSRISLAEARQMANGKHIAVTGRVSALPGMLGSQFFYLSNETGGIQIFRQDKQFPKLELGDTITVSGVRSSFTSVPRIKAEYITLSGKKTLTSTTTTIAEASELPGSLVTISGEITKRLKTNLYFDDGNNELHVIIKNSTGISTNNLTVGDQATITGIIEHTNNGTELWPRSPADIRIQTIIDSQLNTPAPEKRTHWLPLIIIAFVIFGSVVWWKIKKAPRIR